MADIPTAVYGRDGYVAPETIETTREIVTEIEPGEIMLEYLITGTGFGAGRIDTVRRFDDHPGELQVRPWFGGAPIWIPEDQAIEELRGRPLRLVNASPDDTREEACHA